MKKIALCLIGVLALSNTQAVADNKLYACKQQKDSEVLSCELRIDNKADFRSAKIVDGDKSVGADFTPFENLKPAPSMYFLLDSGKMIEAGAFNRLKNVIARTMKPGSVSYGVYRFSRKLEQIAPIGTPQETIRLALNSVSQSTDLTEGLAALDALIQILEADKAEKRTIVLLSDGQFSDSAYSTKEVSDKLKTLGVSVIAVSPRSNSEAVTNAQPIRRLAVETDGEFIVAQNNAAVDQIAPKIAAYNENGGVIRFVPVSKTAKLNVELVNSQLSSEVNAGAGWQPPVTDKPAEVLPETKQTYFEAIRKDPLKLAAVVGGVLVVLILLIFILRAVFFKKPVTPVIQEAVPVRQTPVGYFEFLDGNGSTVPLFAGTVRIGRHESNDVVLRNTSVHRQHAVVSRSNSGAFTIMDLNTENGVVLNGEHITRADLNDHDLIELGEVRLRFRKA